MMQPETSDNEILLWRMRRLSRQASALGESSDRRLILSALDDLHDLLPQLVARAEALNGRLQKVAARSFAADAYQRCAGVIRGRTGRR